MPVGTQITIELPEELSPGEDERLAREGAIINLQQEGRLSIRAAARHLGLDYEDYLSLLAKKGLPASNAEQDPEAFKRLLARAEEIAKRGEG